MILVLVKQKTSRVEYTFDLILKQVLKTDFTFTTDKKVFQQSGNVKISYGDAPVGDEIFFKATELLFDYGIHEHFFDFIQGAEPAFFKVTGGVLPFDPFACSFFMVSRYEEYLPHNVDKYGRFQAQNSVAYKGGFLDRPIVNLWAMQIKRIILERYPSFQFSQLTFTFTPTIDIDNAYAYIHKGILRSALSFMQLALFLDYKKIYERIRVHLGMQKDPYDTYYKQIQIHELHKIKPVYFFLLGNYGKYDKNISYKNAAFQSLIKKLAQHGEVGIHPSYAASNDKKLIKKEQERLERILGHTVTKSRHHFIKISLPLTYRHLIECGIKEDYSMGYPTDVGFRAGIAGEFYFYDLEKEVKTPLKIIPFAAMDVTLKKYLHIRSKEAPFFLKPIIEECRAVGGNFTFIFHNESMGGAGVWKNWADVYARIIKMLIS